MHISILKSWQELELQEEILYNLAFSKLTWTMEHFFFKPTEPLTYCSK